MKKAIWEYIDKPFFAFCSSPSSIVLRLSYFSSQTIVSRSTLFFINIGCLAFYEERALLLGRLKQHEQALTIYTSILHDFDAAEQYCQMYYDRNDSTNSQVSISLTIFLSSADENQKADNRLRIVPLYVLTAFFTSGWQCVHGSRVI